MRDDHTPEDNDIQIYSEKVYYYTENLKARHSFIGARAIKGILLFLLWSLLLGICTNIYLVLKFIGYILSSIF